jgi:hypothetical protein
VTYVITVGRWGVKATTASDLSPQVSREVEPLHQVLDEIVAAGKKLLQRPVQAAD